MKTFPDLSLDIETYGTEPGCVILEVALVAFDSTRKREMATVSVFPSIEEQQKMGFIINMDTMTWWDSHPDARDRQKQMRRVPVSEAVGTLMNFVDDHCKREEVQIWAKGSHFDVPILRTIMRDHWHFRNIHDLRTLKLAADMGGFVVPDVDPNPLPHSGRHDAIHQAAEVLAICSTIAMGR